MLELGQPTHPYDLSLLPGRGLSVRRARAGGDGRDARRRGAHGGCAGRSLGDTGEDCLICDAEGTPVGIGGIMGGASSEIAPDTTEVLLEAAYFTPMAIARTSKRLGLRTEASARFERGCDPWGIEPSVRRFCQLLAESVPGVRSPTASSTCVATCPSRSSSPCRSPACTARSGSPSGRREIAASHRADRVHGPGAGARRRRRRADRHGADQPARRPPRALRGRRRHRGGCPHLRLRQRARGASRPGPSPDGSRRCSAPAARSRTCSRVSVPPRAGPTPSSRPAAHADVGLTGPAVRVSNPLDAEKPFLRRSLMPGLLGALPYNASRRQSDVRLFEVGVVFSHPGEGTVRVVERSGAGGTGRAELPGERELLAASSRSTPTTPGRRWPPGRCWPTRCRSTACA